MISLQFGSLSLIVFLASFLGTDSVYNMIVRYKLGYKSSGDRIDGDLQATNFANPGTCTGAISVPSLWPDNWSNKQGMFFNNNADLSINYDASTCPLTHSSGDYWLFSMFLNRRATEDEDSVFQVINSGTVDIVFGKVRDREFGAYTGTTKAEPTSGTCSICYPYRTWLQLVMYYNGSWTVRINKGTSSYNANFSHSLTHAANYSFKVGGGHAKMGRFRGVLYELMIWKGDSAIPFSVAESYYRFGSSNCSGYCDICLSNSECLCDWTDKLDYGICITCKLNKSQTEVDCNYCYDTTVVTYNSGVCSCPPNYFLSSTSATCTSCSSPTTSSDCEQCITNSVIHNYVCYCPSAMYNNGSGACVYYSPCPSNAHRVGSECYCNSGYKDTDNTPVLSCAVCSPIACSCFDNTVSDGAGFCKCKPGYLDLDPAADVVVCGKCDDSQANCDTCYGYTPSGDSLAIQIWGGCQCTTGYYDDDSSSSVLDCKLCTTNCSKCWANTVLSDTKCVCAAGYYDKEPLSYKIDCALCSSSPFTCTECDPDSFYYDGYCACPVGKFDTDSGIGILCQVCNTDDNTCNLCYPNSEYNPSTAQCQCPPGIYYDSDRSEGIACELCNTSDLGCAMCFAGTILLAEACQCPLDTYDADPSDNQFECIPCSTTEESCQMCFENSIRYDASCVCKDGYYDASYSAGLVCRTCDPSCKTCWGPLSRNCLLCKDPFAVAKYDSPCECQGGYYSSSNGCAQCMEDCLTCSNGTTCDSCRDKNAEVIKGLCQCKENLKTILSAPLMCSRCPQGTYHEGGQCVGCNPECETCEKAAYCLTCLNPELVPAETGGCKATSCKEGYYLIGRVCEPCKVLCLVCEGTHNNCSKCVPRATIQTDGSCKCDQGFEIFDFKCMDSSLRVSFQLLSDSPSEFTLTFSKDIANSLKASDLHFEVDGKPVSFQLEKVSDSEYRIITAPSQGIASVTLTNPGAVVAGSDYWLTKLTSSISIEEAEKQGDGERTWLDDINDYLPHCLKILVGALVILQWVFGGFAWHLIGFLQMLSYVPLMDFDLPSDLEDFLRALNLYNSVPNLVSMFLIDTDSFIVNVSRWGTTLALGTFVWAIVIILKNLLEKRAYKFLITLSTSFKWSFFVRLGLLAALDLYFFSLKQIKATGSQKPWEISNSIAASITIVLLTLAISLQASITFVYDKTDPDSIQKWDTLFAEFKPNLLSASFNLLFLVRRVQYILLICFLDTTPMIWLIDNTLHSLVALTYQISVTPFKSKAMNYFNLAAEVLFGIALVTCSVGEFTPQLSLKVVVVAAVFLIIGISCFATADVAYKAVRGQKLQVVPDPESPHYESAIEEDILFTRISPFKHKTVI